MKNKFGNISKKNFILINRILLGLIMLLPGITKLFILGPERVIDMLTNLNFIFPIFFAWILILSEIIFGIFIIINFKTKYSIIPAIIILIVSALTAHMSDPLRILMHLTLIINYLFVAYYK